MKTVDQIFSSGISHATDFDDVLSRLGCVFHKLDLENTSAQTFDNLALHRTKALRVLQLSLILDSQSFFAS